MMLKSYIKNYLVKSAIVIGVFLYFVFFNFAYAGDLNFDAPQKQIKLNDNGAEFEVISEKKTVGDFLNEQKIHLNPNDVVLPELGAKIYSGTNVIILRAKKITIKEGGNTTTSYTMQSTVEQAVWENKNIELDEDDITVPGRTMPIKDGDAITITHVLIKEEIKQQDIDFKTIANEDDELGWRVKKVTQKGEKGVKEVKYKVVYNDGKEISRKVLQSDIIKNPVEEVVTQGTYVKTGKTSTGVASWYAYTGTMAAANPWLPMGSYVRVTNQDNGKSVIVKINDRGPFGNGRIIDLDKVAFAQIASLGAGVANVKMEPILN